jgi:hypothetical protein
MQENKERYLEWGSNLRIPLAVARGLIQREFVTNSSDDIESVAGTSQMS